ncbi:hypothetical protein PTTG_10648, partial [Puccinia triticina 1-1 BBBD Race 1]|uniref:Uncharacterized protein n=1 Tax=Puccinia triticina (isolate 1-1 / race 1 (BBBD)) TaxID=630390 RepID=A0A0C4FBP9_PUCT1
MMEDIVGRDEAICLIQDWIPGEDLNALERTLYQQNLDAERRAPPITTAQTNTNLALAPHPGHQPLVATPTPEPQTTRHQAQKTSYQGPICQDSGLGPEHRSRKELNPNPARGI